MTDRLDILDNINACVDQARAIVYLMQDRDRIDGHSTDGRYVLAAYDVVVEKIETAGMLADRLYRTREGGADET